MAFRSRGLDLGKVHPHAFPHTDGQTGRSMPLRIPTSVSLRLPLHRLFIPPRVLLGFGCGCGYHPTGTSRSFPVRGGEGGTSSCCRHQRITLGTALNKIMNSYGIYVSPHQASRPFSPFCLFLVSVHGLLPLAMNEVTSTVLLSFVCVVELVPLSFAFILGTFTTIPLAKSQGGGRH